MLKLVRTVVVVIALVAPVAVLSTASAQTSQNRQSGGTQGHNMSTMDMNQMMEHCRQIQGMDRARMNADTKKMAAQCDQMMKAHGGQFGSSGAQSGTRGGTTSKQPPQ